MTDTSERRESLWMLTVSPVVWAGHFLLSYATASVWCAKASGPDVSLGPVRIAIALFTVVALALIGGVGWRSGRRHLHRGGTTPHGEDTELDRYRFLGFAALLLSALSAVAVLYSAMVAAFIGDCR